MNLVDLGKIMRDAEAIKAARVRTRALESQMADKNALRSARTDYMKGDGSALERMSTIDPAAATDFVASIEAMDAPRRAAVKAQTEMMGRAAAAILNAPPEQRAQLYKEIRASMPAEIQSRIPEEYNEGNVRWALANAVETDKLFAAAEKRAMRAEDRSNALADKRRQQERDDQVYARDRADDLEDAERKRRNALADAAAAAERDDRIYERDRNDANRDAARDQKYKLDLEREKAKTKTKKAGGLESSESNAIARAVQSVYGGTFISRPDGTLEFAGLDDKAAREALEVHARAEEIMLEARAAGRSIAPGMAAREALRERRGGGAGGASPKLPAGFVED